MLEIREKVFRNLVSISSNFYQQLLHNTDPKKCKKDGQLYYLFALLGSACANAARRMLMKLTSDHNLRKTWSVEL